MRVHTDALDVHFLHHQSFVHMQAIVCIISVAEYIYIYIYIRAVR